MLTEVILEGAMGKKFGRQWNLSITSPADALRLIDANSPGLFQWVRDQLAVYSRYQVVCEYEDGRIEEMDNDTYLMECKPVRVRFVPLVEGSSGAVRFVVGLVITIIGVWFNQPWAVKIGVSLMIGGAIEMLTAKPKNDRNEKESKNKTSNYFDGPVNTTIQGVPVPLIYGRVLTGSHHISAAVTIDQVIDPDYVAPPSLPADPYAEMSGWVPVTDPLGGIAGYQNPSTGEMATYNGYAWVDSQGNGINVFTSGGIPIGASPG